jgi:hypothetical protein
MNSIYYDEVTCSKCQFEEVKIEMTISEEAAMIVEQLLQCRRPTNGQQTVSEEASMIVMQLLATLQNE